MAANWTDEQRAAISVRDKKVLVAAGAGSGKTAVLTERVISRITDEKDPVDIDELLIMTFTRAAASEMRDRIFKRIEETISDYPYGSKMYERLRRQAVLVEYAKITTIDSFCLSVIREHIDMTPLDPSFRIADQGEINIIKDEVLSELMEEKYDSADEGYIRLVDSFAGAKSDVRIKEYIENLYSFASAKPWPQKWLKELLNSYKDGHDRKLWQDYIIERIKYIASDIEKKIVVAIDLCDKSEGLAGYKKTFEYESGLIKRLASVGDYEELQSALKDFDFPMIGRAGKDADPDLKNMAKSIRDDYKKIIKDNFIKNFLADIERLELEEKSQYAAADVLINLCIEYMDRLIESKVEKNVADFNDLEHFALDILYKDGKKSTAALEYALQFKEIYIDEYQDSNYVQEELVNAIENGNVFMVGDVKQSIYAFRQAKPELFNHKYNTYKRYVSRRDDLNTENHINGKSCNLRSVRQSSDLNTTSCIGSRETLCTKECAGKDILINLKKNFRSRGSVIDGINALFYKIMSSGLGGIDYDSESALYKGAKYEDIDDERGKTSIIPQLILYEEPGDIAVGDDFNDEGEKNQDVYEDYGHTNDILRGIELEAVMISKKIKSMISGEGEKPFLVRDSESGDYRRLKYSDIAILFRAVSGRAEIFVDALISEGIPAYAQTSAGYFDTLEVRVVLAMLQAIDNPYSEVELAAFLHSPVVGLCDNELAEIIYRYKSRMYEKKHIIMLYDACIYALNIEPESFNKDTVHKIKKALDMLSGYKEMSRYTKLSELLVHIYEETGYLDYVSVLEAGDIRRANLIMLVEKAAAYEETGLRGLFNFIRYIDNLKQYNTDYGEASLLGEFDNTVRIMSIHKSKGLEFPVCFIANMGKQFNFQETKSPIVIDSELGIACDYIDPQRRVKWSSIKKNVLKYRMKQQALGEEIRILYVAMSRAKEALIMTACVKDYEKVIEKYTHLINTDGHLSTADTGAASSFLDWLLMAQPYIKENIEIKCERYKQGKACENNYIKAENITERLHRLKEEFNKALNNKNAEKSEYEYNDIKKLIEKPYKFNADIELCTKMNIMQIHELNKNESNKKELNINALNKNTLSKKEEKTDYKIQSFNGPHFNKTAAKLSDVPDSQADEEYTLFLDDDSDENNSGFINKNNKAFDRGSAFHRIMEIMDYNYVSDIKSLNKFIGKMLKEGFISFYEKDNINITDVMNFINSDLGKLFKEALNNKTLKREKAFTMTVPANQLGVSSSDEPVLIQGIIDAYIEQSDSVILVDYKTDRVDSQEELIERYSFQLEYYQKAIEAALQKKVEKKYIWSCRLNKKIEL
ncbi:UvrD-helicase domain-containing protein [Johnsonella ignava]|uniref:UvrD-helicase domain-containing protein n=1 Tax=Johnsonella ignava TaxID=43995 RepID=UPI0023F3B1C7|nr:UvrD-helicase domain-containing protein [Johnsonella ignava]